MKTSIFILLFSFVFEVAAQESHLSNLALSENRYQINASLSLLPGSHNSYQVFGGLSYFFRTDLSLDGFLSAYSSNSKNVLAPGIGLSYYFLKSDSVAPFVSQSFSTTLDSDVGTSSTTSFGALVLFSPHIGFKPSANFKQNLKIQSRSFDVNGSFTFIY